MSACIDDLKEKLAAAEDAYNKLMLGQAPRVVVDQNGERVEFTAASASKLLGYISSLRDMINRGDCSGLGYTGKPPAGFLF